MIIFEKANNKPAQNHLSFFNTVFEKWSVNIKLTCIYDYSMRVPACGYRPMRKEHFTSCSEYYPTFNQKCATFLTDTITAGWAGNVTNCSPQLCIRSPKKVNIQPLTSNTTHCISCRKQHCLKGSNITVLYFTDKQLVSPNQITFLIPFNSVSPKMYAKMLTFPKVCMLLWQQ